MKSTLTCIATTTCPVYSVSSHAVGAPPATNPPPWMYIITGSAAAAALAFVTSSAPDGVKTLSTRQSSLVEEAVGTSPSVVGAALVAQQFLQPPKQFAAQYAGGAPMQFFGGCAFTPHCATGHAGGTTGAVGFGHSYRCFAGSAVHEKVQPPNEPQTPHPHVSGAYPWSLQYEPHGEAGCGLGGPAPCVHLGPAYNADRGDLHIVCGFGGMNRRVPIGGAAYGMPRKPATPFLTTPVTGPDAVCTVGPLATPTKSACSIARAAAARVLECS